MVATSESAPVISWSSTLVITSPFAMPASAAVEPAVTSWTWAPCSDLRAAPGWRRRRRRCRGGRGSGSRPCSSGRRSAAPRRSGSRSRGRSSRPRPRRELAVRIEELMPTTLPVMSTSAPPLLPGLIAASVWMAGYVVLLPVAVGADVDRAVQRADDAAGDGGVEAERRADRHDALADLEVARTCRWSPGSGPRRPRP